MAFFFISLLLNGVINLGIIGGGVSFYRISFQGQRGLGVYAFRIVMELKHMWYIFWLVLSLGCPWVIAISISSLVEIIVMVLFLLFTFKDFDIATPVMECHRAAWWWYKIILRWWWGHPEQIFQNIVLWFLLRRQGINEYWKSSDLIVDFIGFLWFDGEMGLNIVPQVAQHFLVFRHLAGSLCVTGVHSSS